MEDKTKALELNEKLIILKQFKDEENIFLDYTAESNGGVFSKKQFKFKIYYRYESI
jgi:hypothetical protein